MDNPKVSILVPVYGVEKYIEQCVVSLFEQSYDNCEFIFVNDATPDSSIEVLKVVVNNYPQRKNQVKIVNHAKNCGVAQTRNSALDNAEGDYILFVDSDDWVETTIVEKLVEKSLSCDADIVNAWCANAWSDGKVETVFTPWLKSREEHIKAVLGQSHIVPNNVRGMLFKRYIYNDNGLRFTPGVDFGEDYSLLPQLLYYAHRLESVCEPLYLYRLQNNGSYMNNINKRHTQSYVEANSIVNNFFMSISDSCKYLKAIELGRVNLKKWIAKRGFDPLEYDEYIFKGGKVINNSIYRLYNCVVDSRNMLLIKMMSVLINLPLYIKYKCRSI